MNSKHVLVANDKMVNRRTQVFGESRMRNLEGIIARILDVAMIAGGAFIASSRRFSTGMPEGLAALPLIYFVLLSIGLSATIFSCVGIYRPWRGRSIGKQVGAVLFCWACVQAGGLVSMFVLHQTDLVSRLWFGYWTLATGAMLAAPRLFARLVLARVRRGGLNLRNVAIVARDARGYDVIRTMDANPAAGFRASVLYQAGTDKLIASAAVPVFDDIDLFSAYVRSERIREIWLALPLSDVQMVLGFSERFGNDLVNIRFIPDFTGLALFDSRIVDLIGLPAINLAASPLSKWDRLAKELFDRAFAAVAILVVAPLLLALAAAIKMSSPGPVFFTQLRTGADGNVFRIYKFRSMRVHAEERGSLRQASQNDSRTTRIGWLMRRTSLDELPQFFNVLRGEMSVVGPRPHALEHDEIYQSIVSGYIHRYRIKPGITGWAQINGFRGETDRIEKMQSRVEYDLFYLRNWSFGLDIRIVLATILRGFVHSNAY
jgi:Undecaprenyl-phosphate glucose phosphotransferase